MLIFKNGPIEIYHVGNEYFVYGITVGGDPRICPSLGMAHELAAQGPVR
jgi:hypothetical protein